MSKGNIIKRIRTLSEKNKKAISIYLTFGYPSIKTTEKLIYLLSELGVDMIELGLPFSDPIADGPTIQYSSAEALKHKVNIYQLLSLTKKVKRNISVPIILMSYLNPIYQMFKDSNHCRQLYIFDGIIIPDLIIEEENILPHELRQNVDIIYLVSPTTTEERIKHILSKTDGFAYIVSVTGVTGARGTLPSYLMSFLRKVKKMSKNKPILLGFGISNPKQIMPYLKTIDGIIIGSAIIDIIRGSSSEKEMFSGIKSFIEKFTSLLH
jgi:tryptophan synthase alpha chain